MKWVFDTCKNAVINFIKAVLQNLRSLFSDCKNRIQFSIIVLASIACLIVFIVGAYPILYALFWTVLIGTIAFLIVRKNREALARLLWALGPFLSFLMVEYMIGNITLFPFTCALKTPKEIILNLIWYYMVAGALYLAVGRRKSSAIISAAFFLIWGLADSYFFAFRGRVIFPSDFLALRTAVNVIGEYNFLPSSEQFFGALILVIYIVCMALMPKVRGRKFPGWFVTVPAAAVCAGYICLFFFTPFLKWTGFEDKLWTSLWQTRQNGVVLNFTVNLRFSSVEKPEDYEQHIEELTKEYESESAVVSEETVRPNIIAIMNESFCDLSVIGIETNESCTPFLDSLEENTIKGYTYVSVFSGHTANSEYEFLTGNSISFLPVGTVAYQMFTHENDYSLAGQLNALGYYSIAMHPYDSSGWNRVSVYNRYGFDEMHFIEDFENVVKIRDYCSDRSNYENLISVYEKHQNSNNNGSPLFIFNITMQNHGGYSVNWSGLDKTMWLTGNLKGKFESVDMYLSLARESDSAFAELVEYFQNVSEPTIVVMFGDHQPGLSDRFYESVFGQKKDTLSQEESVCLYQVPYIIWANYDIEEKEYEDFSLNYLSTVLIDTIGYPKTGYQQFLSQAMEALPIVTRNFYRDAEGVWSGNPSAVSDEAQSILSEYAILQYNGLKNGDARFDAYFNLKTGK